MKYRSEFKHGFANPEVVARRCSIKKAFLRILQNSQENTCTRVSFFNKFSGFRPATLLKKSLWHRCYLVNFVKFSKNIFFYRTPLVAASPNRGYLHRAIVKALHGFQEKRALKSSDMLFFFQNVPNEIFNIFKMFENNMKFTRVAC